MYIWEHCLMRINYLFLCLIFATACAQTMPPPDEFVERDVRTSIFTLRTYQKLTDKNGAVKIYIEGDGHAFDGHGRPTDNPTPRSDFVRRLAFDDPSPNVIYLARPCQYVKDEECDPTDWTGARFSNRAADSAADAILQIAGNRPVILIGFSGGAQIAGLVSVRSPELNVKKIITIAGNLDHAEWTRMKKFPPLNESLDLNWYKEEFKKIPQIHFVGEKDIVIPADLTMKFIDDRSRIITVPNAEHGKGFDEIYYFIWEEK